MLQSIKREIFPSDVTRINYLNVAENLLKKVPAVIRSMSGLEHLNIGHNPLQVG